MLIAAQDWRARKSANQDILNLFQAAADPDDEVFSQYGED